MIMMARSRAFEDDDDLTALRQCMRAEEDLRRYRRHTPWRGEYRFFRPENVACIEHFRQSSGTTVAAKDRKQINK
jgi:hypothetical protein